MMVEINADKEEAEVVRVKVEAEEAMANEKVFSKRSPEGGASCTKGDASTRLSATRSGFDGTLIRTAANRRYGGA